LDSGSTTTELAKMISGFTNLNVITNALNIALILGADSNINLNVTGGEFKSPTLSLTGEKAASYFNNIHADKVFLATAGINLKTGLTYPSISDLVVKKAMIDVSDKVYLVADSTKIGKSSFASLGALSLVDRIITDSNISEEDAKLFEHFDLKYTVAEI
jgi:DeoR/GlpR family transcriptional regulator of sugar metabolism